MARQNILTSNFLAKTAIQAVKLLSQEISRISTGSEVKSKEAEI